MSRNNTLLLIATASLLLSSQAVLSKIEVEPIASLPKPVSVTWTGSALIASSRDGATKLVKVGADGSVQPFAASFSGQGEVYVAVSPGQAGFPAGDLFLCSGDSIYELDPAGTSSRLFSTPSAGTTITFLAFDSDGAWGFLLYALGAAGQLWAIDSNGHASLVTNLGNNLTPEGVAVAPPALGRYAGEMLVSLEGSHSIVAIPKGNPSNATTLATFPGEAPERIMVIPANSDLFLAKFDLGVIVRVNASAFAGHVGSLLVITEGEAGQRGSMSVVRAVGGNLTTTTLFQDTTSPHFEGASFVPSGVVTAVVLSAASTSTSTSASPSLLPYAGLAVGAGAVAAVAIAFAVIRWRRGAQG